MKKKRRSTKEAENGNHSEKMERRKSPYRVLIWGVGYGYSQYINAIKYQEILNEIKVIGVIGRDVLYDYLDGVPFLSWPEITGREIDYIVITSDKNFTEIAAEAVKLGFSEDLLVKAKVFALPGFRFFKYVSLRSPAMSIISNNCWGGISYNSLGMGFSSPFINMFIEDSQYLRLLRGLKDYLKLRLKFIRLDPAGGYPVCGLGDIELHCIHYSNMDDVEEKWYERVGRINWDNLFIMMFTTNPQIVADFDQLDFEKKICFVPFESSLKSAYYLQIVDRDEMRDTPFWKIVNMIARGYYHDYDLIDLLCEGRVVENRCNSSGRSVRLLR